jgi:hypothetical protein
MNSIVTDCVPVVPLDKVNCPQRGPTLPALRSGIGVAEMPTILIVDDCPAVRKTLRGLLEKQLCSAVTRSGHGASDGSVKFYIELRSSAQHSLSRG